MNQRILIQVVIFVVFIDRLTCSDEQKQVSLNEIPKDSVRIILGPWANESEVPPDRRGGYDLINIKTEASGELSVHLPKYAFGVAWCHITAPGYEPAFLSGTVPEIQNNLKQYRDLKLKLLDSDKNGVITGVTYYDMQGRGVNHPVSTLVNGAKVTFTNETKRKYHFVANAEGRYMAILPAGKYTLKTSHAAYEGATADVKEFHELGWIEVRPGQTTIQDLILSTLYVD